MDGRDQATRNETAGAQGIAGLAARVVARLVDRDGPSPSVLREDLVLRFMDGVITPSPGGIEAIFADLRRAGVSRIAFADRYIPEIARRLGRAWEDDSLGFADVTVGMSRLQAILREIGRDWSADHDPAPVRRAATVLLIVPEKEQHTLGAMVLMGLLRRRGISVALRIAPSAPDLRGLFAGSAFDAVMVSVGQASGVEACRTLVRTLKDLTHGRMPIAVGGAVLGIMQDVREQTGADMASNDLGAVILALGLDRVAPLQQMAHEAARGRE
jgi:methylmalonyl-CoA mutase cobalamin-binding subunit